MFRHPDCYANNISECDTKISGEHIVSRNVLKQLGEKTIRVANWAGAGENGADRGVGALESKVLCRRHNSALAPLDAALGAFFRDLLCASDGQLRGDYTYRHDGDTIERALLKIACGMVAAGTFKTTSGVEVTRQVPDSWVKVLFGTHAFPFDCGLHLHDAQIGRSLSVGTLDVAVSPLLAASIPQGVVVSLTGFEFSLRMRVAGGLGPSLYRPREIIVNHRNGRASLELGWPIATRTAATL